MMLIWPPDSRYRTAVWVGLASAVPLVYYWCTSTRFHRQNRQRRNSTDFGAFLKKDVTKTLPKHLRNPTDFGAFLKGNSTNNIDEAGPNQQVSTLSTTLLPGPEDKVVTVLFGTEYGFSKEVADKLCELLKTKASVWPQLLDMAKYCTGFPLDKEQVVLVVVSTQGDGVPPNEAREFFDWLHTSGAPQLDSLSFSVCALGDRSYQHYCRCGKQFDARLEQLGAIRLVDRQDVNREDWMAIDSWIDAVCTRLAAMDLKTVAQLGGFSMAAGDAGDDASAAKRWSKSRPYPATVSSITNLCQLGSGDDKVTVCVDIDLADSGIQYIPGDALGIYPQNRPEDVDELLHVLHTPGDEIVDTPSWHHNQSSSHMTIRDALCKCFDIRSPKPQLFDLLLEYALPDTNGHHATQTNTNGVVKVPANGLVNGVSHESTKGNGHHGHSNGNKQVTTKQRLQSLMNSGVQEYLDQRHVVDILKDFPAQPPLAKLLLALRPLVPRLYSISSSMRENPLQVSVTVAVVRYDCLNKERVGVCSTYLAERIQVGAQVCVYVHKNPDFRLPASPSTPLIMVGPGTGLAPFRSFMQERIISSQKIGQPFGDCWLYFGSRRRDQDFLYGDLLERWHAAGYITLVTAFSRECASKVYVQHRLRETGEDVWQLLQQGAHFYVCGDAASMAGDVETALLDIIGDHVEGGRGQAQEYLDDMIAGNRYQRDIW